MSTILTSDDHSRWTPLNVMRFGTVEALIATAGCLGAVVVVDTTFRLALRLLG